MKRLEHILKCTAMGTFIFGLFLPVLVQWTPCEIAAREWLSQGIALPDIVLRVISQFGSLNGTFVGAVIGIANGIKRPAPTAIDPISK